MKAYNLFAATAIAVATVSVANAADLGASRGSADKMTVLDSSVSPNWAGWYVGAHIGYGWGNYDASYKAEKSASSVSKCTDKDAALVGYGMTRSECVPADSENDFSPPIGGGDKGSYLLGSVSEIGSGEFDMDSMLWGAGISYKIKRERFIFEPFVDASIGGGDFRKSWSGDVSTFTDHYGHEQDVPGFLGNVTESGFVSVDKKWDATLGMKAGFLLTSRDYVYGLVGLSYGRFKIEGGSLVASDADDLSDATIKTSYSKSDGAWGYTVGGGWEHALTSNVNIGVEGRYTAFSDIGASGSTSKNVELFDGHLPLNLSGSESLNGGFDDWSVRARISYHFGG